MKNLLVLLFALGLCRTPVARPEDSKQEAILSGVSAEGHKDSKKRVDDFRLDTFQSSHITKTTNPLPSQLVSFKIPVATVTQEQVTAAMNAAVAESLGGAKVHVKMPVPFIRPAGPLPSLPDRFGFDEPEFGPDAMPNCGCFPRGGCLGKAGAYTKMVRPFTDLKCGHNFDPCCFDGRWPGVYDSFAEAASCVAKEECLRPYGVLPTDIRDFGVIAPCPGQGAVRCLMVDDAALLEFQDAVAAIGAANAYNALFASKPAHFVVPIVHAGVGIGSQPGAESSSTISALSASSHLEEGGEDDPAIHPAVQPIPSYIVNPPPAAQPNIIVNSPVDTQPNIIVNPPAAAQPNIIVNSPVDTQPNIILNPPAAAQPNFIVNPPAAAQPNIIVNPPAAIQPNFILDPPAPSQPNFILNPSVVPQPNFVFNQPAALQPNIIVRRPYPGPFSFLHSLFLKKLMMKSMLLQKKKVKLQRKLNKFN